MEHKKKEIVLIVTGLAAACLVIYAIYRMEKNTAASAQAAQNTANQLANSSVSGISANALSAVASSPTLTLDTSVPTSTASTSNGSSIDGDLSPNTTSILNQLISVLTTATQQPLQTASTIAVSNTNVNSTSGLTNVGLPGTVITGNPVQAPVDVSLGGQQATIIAKPITYPVATPILSNTVNL